MNKREEKRGDTWSELLLPAGKLKPQRCWEWDVGVINVFFYMDSSPQPSRLLGDDQGWHCQRWSQALVSPHGNGANSSSAWRLPWLGPSRVVAPAGHGDTAWDTWEPQPVAPMSPNPAGWVSKGLQPGSSLVPSPIPTGM